MERLLEENIVSLLPFLITGSSGDVANLSYETLIRLGETDLVCPYCNGTYVAPSKGALSKHVNRNHRDIHKRWTKLS